jgi:hypothetical protein
MSDIRVGTGAGATGAEIIRVGTAFHCSSDSVTATQLI